MTIAALAARFITELAGIAAVGYAGFQLAAPMPLRAIAAVGGPLALVITWGMVVAPNAASGLTQPQKDLVGSGLLLLAAAVLALAGQLRLAIAFAVVVIASTALLIVLGHDARESVSGIAR
jgi:hypothetical protein